MYHRLQPYIEMLLRQPLESGLSDEAVIALSNSYSALLQLVVANDADDICGSRRHYAAALDTLHALCRKRSSGNQSLARRSRMLPLLYQTLTVPQRIGDLRTLACCLDRTDRAWAEWCRRQATEAPAGHEQACRTEYGLLCALVEQFSYWDETEKRQAPEFNRLQQRIATWMNTRNEQGIWPQLTDEEAWMRLTVISRFVAAHGDATLGSALEQTCTGYLNRMRTEAPLPDETYWQIYEIATYGPGIPDGRVVERLIRQAERRLTQLPEEADARLWPLAICIDRTCLQIHQAIKAQRMAHSA